MLAASRSSRRGSPPTDLTVSEFVKWRGAVKRFLPRPSSSGSCRTAASTSCAGNTPFSARQQAELLWVVDHQNITRTTDVFVNVEGRDVGSVARELNIGETVVRRWVQQADASGSADSLSPDERAELKRLRKENQELRMEKEILRKATAFFAKESR